MRLIDADKLIANHTERISYKNSWHETEEDEFIAVKNIQDAPTEPQWIPVEKEMPPIGRVVLVYAISDDGDHYFMTTASHEGGKYWYDECFYQRMPKVYAWMQLPKPYEVKL